MDFILAYLMSSADNQQPQERGTQFTDLPSEVLERISNYQEEEIERAGGRVRLNARGQVNFHEGGDFFDRMLARYGPEAVEDEMDRLQRRGEEWREELGRAILVNNWLRKMAGMTRMNPAQLLRLQLRRLN